jgi:hypothetical protein
MIHRQLNAWNWEMKVGVYVDGYQTQLVSFSIQQYWDGTKGCHERLHAAAIAHLEAQSDRLGLAYMAHRPEEIKGRSWANSTPLVVKIDRFPF